MQSHELEPIVRRLVKHLRLAQDAISRACDALDDGGMQVGRVNYVAKQTLRSGYMIEKALWDCRELPEGDRLVSATATQGHMERVQTALDQTLTDAVEAAYARKEATNGEA